MVIKIKKEGKFGDGFRYKGSKKIITTQDIKEADKFDAKLRKTIEEIERVLLEKKIVSDFNNRKTDPLRAWYLIGSHINRFLKKNNILKADENLFWTYLYGRSLLLNKKMPVNKVGESRNDFKTASMLAKYPFQRVRNVGPWALWREILGYKVFLNDRRILDLIVEELTKSPKKRLEARIFLKALADGFKNIDTSVLNNKELLERFDKIILSI